MSVDILGTSWDQCRSMVQYSFMSTETRRLLRTATSTLTQLWTMINNIIIISIFIIYTAQNLLCRDYSKSIHVHGHTHTHAHAYTHTHTHTHTGTYTHECANYTRLNLHNLKWAANRNYRWVKMAALNGKHDRSIVSLLGKQMFWGYTWMSPDHIQEYVGIGRQSTD